MKAEVGRGAAGAEPPTDAKSDKLELERGAAAKTENKIDKTAKRIVTMTVTGRPPYENHQPLSALWRF